MPYVTTTDSVELYYQDEGAGLPVLCLPGLTRNTRDFDHVTPHLIEMGARVIRMDYRGRGRSDWPGPETYTVPHEARDALAVLDHLGLARAAVLGTSRGGLISMVLASMAKERLLGVALNDIGPEIAQSGLDDIDAYLGREPRARRYEDLVAARAAALPGFAHVPESRWLADIEANYEQTPEGLRNRYDNRLRDAVQATDMAPDLWPFFNKMTDLPLALIWGMNSNLLLEATVRKMQAACPGMILAEVPDRGHIPFLDEPESLSALAAWLEAMA